MGIEGTHSLEDLPANGIAEELVEVGGGLVVALEFPHVENIKRTLGCVLCSQEKNLSW